MFLPKLAPEVTTFEKTLVTPSERRCGYVMGRGTTHYYCHGLQGEPIHRPGSKLAEAHPWKELL